MINKFDFRSRCSVSDQFKQHVLQFLEANNLGKMCSVSSVLRFLASSDIIWLQKCRDRWKDKVTDFRRVLLSSWWISEV